MNEKPVVKRVIQRCGCDAILPFALMYVFYIIFHGHLSPGGGFQGGERLDSLRGNRCNRSDSSTSERTKCP